MERSLGAPIHPKYSVRTEAGHVRWAPARCFMIKYIGHWCIENRLQKISISLLKQRKYFEPLRARINTTFSRSPSPFPRLVQHEAGWPWVDSLSRSKVCCCMSWLLIRVDRRVLTIETWKCCAAQKTVIKNSRFPTAAVRECLKPDVVRSNE